MQCQFIVLFLFLVCMTFGDSPGSDYREIVSNSNLFLSKNVSAESEAIIMKILSTGYMPSSEELARLHFCSIMIGKNGHFIELDANMLSQIIQVEVDASAKYSISNGLKRLQESVSYKEITSSEMASMKQSFEAMKK